LFVYDELEVYNFQFLADAAVDSLRKPWKVTDLSLYEGVPGAGKTVTLVRRAKATTLVLGACKSTVEEIRGLLGAVVNPDHCFYNSKVQNMKLMRNVRTIDSYMRFPNITAEQVFVDEGLMVHAGQLVAALRLAGAVKVTIFGDRIQIPFINRDRMFANCFGALELYTRIEYCLVTKRCPVDVVLALLEVYPGFKTVKTVMRSINVVKINTVTTLKKCANTKYIVFTQNEKATMQKMGFNAETTLEIMNTVGEVQGGTYKKIAVVRLDDKATGSFSIYNSQPHCVVALTRHTEEFTYYTCSDERDLLHIYYERSLRIGRLPEAIVTSDDN